MRVRAMLLLGGNIGDVAERIDRAVELLEKRALRVVRRSSMMRSEAWGMAVDTAPFTNQAVEVECDTTAEELLDTTQAIERELGRDRAKESQEKERRQERYASRGIDIDIIFYGEESINTPRLKVPHPLMGEREFVLHPIVEIAPEWRNIVLGRSCRELLIELESRKE